jgi:serine/threonine-protein kinase
MTVAYAAPERFDAVPKSLPAGDIFSLGVLLYELATGDVPWMGNGGMSLKTGADVPELPEGFSEPFQLLLKRMMSLKPEERPRAALLSKSAGQLL